MERASVTEGRRKSERVEGLADHIATLATTLTAGEFELVEAIGDFDQEGGWSWQGAVSCAHWLSWRIGMDLGAAREKVRVAKALRELPKIRTHFRTLRLSYSKVRAMTRVATVENEAQLIQLALGGTAAQLERICRRFRAVLRTQSKWAPLPCDVDRDRRLYHHSTDTGHLRIVLEVPADEGARVLAAVEKAYQALRAEHAERISAEIDKPEILSSRNLPTAPQTPSGAEPQISAELSRPTDATYLAKPAPGPKPTQVDAFLLLADAFLAQDSSVSASLRGSGPPCEVVLHTELEVLREGVPGTWAENGGGLAIEPDAARRMACDASVVPVLEDDRGNVLDIGRRSRRIPAALRRALHLRENQTCAFPGCTHQRFLDAHHIHHWADGGETKLDNLVLLCSHHHRFVHEHHWTIECLADGLRIFVSPQGERFSCCPPMKSLRVDNAAGISIGKALHAAPHQEEPEDGANLRELRYRLLPPDWRGESVDMLAAVGSLVSTTPSAFS